MSPFHENSEDDVATRLRERVVQWEQLPDLPVTVACYDFLARLLQEDPQHRSTIAGAMEHPWLATHWPTWTFNDRVPVNNVASKPANWPEEPSELFTKEMLLQILHQNAAALRGDESMSVDDDGSSQSQEEGPSVDSLFPPSQSQPSQSQGGGGGGKLRRRGRVLDEAAEANVNIPGPTEAMLEAARNAEREERGKRRRDQDSAMIEDDQDALMGSPRKKRGSPV
jgi:serine/threonine protein kinase